jgi:hypothetical protein
MTTDTSVTLPRKKHSVMWWIGGVFLLLFALFLWQLFGPSPPIIVSRETTYITAPLKPSGLPDYGQYVLDKAREGVTPENNAAVLLWQAIWPGDLEPEHYEVMADELGLEEIPSADESLQSLYGDRNRQRVLAWLKERQSGGEDKETSVDAPTDDSDEDAVYAVIGQAVSRAWTSADIPPLAAWIAENKKPLDMLVAASQRSRYYSPSPNLIDGSNVPLIVMSSPDGAGLRDVASSLSARAMWHVGEGRPAEAWRDLLAVRRLAQLQSRDGTTLVYELIAIRNDGVAAVATVTLLDQSSLTPEEAKQVQRDLAALPIFSAVADTIDEGERFIFLQTVFTARSDGSRGLAALAALDPHYSLPLPWASVDWNDVLREGNRWYDRASAAMHLPTGAARKAALTQMDTDLQSRIARASRRSEWFGGLMNRGQRSDQVAAVLLDMFLQATDAAPGAQDRANTNLTLVRLAAGLAVYRAEHGTYPENLDDLVPGVVPALPVDLYNGKPFFYQRDGEGYLLYSAGANGTDDGGSHKDWSILAGRQLNDLPDDEAEKLRGQIPAGADDISIRVPRLALELPEPAPQDRSAR